MTFSVKPVLTCNLQREVLLSKKMTNTFTPTLSQHSTFVWGKREVGDRFGVLGWGVVVKSDVNSFNVCNFQSPKNCRACTVHECPIKRRIEG